MRVSEKCLTREEEMKEVPLWTANQDRWPPGVRTISMDQEMDCLGVDRLGNLYSDGTPLMRITNDCRRTRCHRKLACRPRNRGSVRYFG